MVHYCCVARLGGLGFFGFYKVFLCLSREFGPDNILCSLPARLIQCKLLLHSLMSLNLPEQRFSLDKHHFAYILPKSLFAP